MMSKTWIGFYVLYVTISLCGTARSRGCTGPLILPDTPFFIVWNHPTQICEQRGINLDFEKWGIVDNSKDFFYGEQITLLYTLGNFPQYQNQGKIIKNGGIPQLGNLTLHLQKVAKDIRTMIPSPSFNGLGVIDFEAWRPLFFLNFDALKIYEEKSIELAKQRFPKYNSSQVLVEAIKEFQTSARSYMESTILATSYLRPNGRWGYYGYPRCWETYCNGSTVQINDQMSWIYKLSNSLYPSIYLGRNVPEKDRATTIKHVLHEALRVKATWSPPDADVLPYSLMQDAPLDFFTKKDLSYSIGQPADMGSSGVVLWGSSSMMHAKNECLALQQYINNTLGPFSLSLKQFFANCSQIQCQGHGRCVRKDYESIYQHHLRKSGRTECLISAEKLTMNEFRKENSPLKNINKKNKINWDLKFMSEKSGTDQDPHLANIDKMPVNAYDNYICKCFAGWSGDHCEQKGK